jgi:predicted regulator of Ras-like GTPase activity (Roadblock/LC7/MglB family)
MLHSFSFTAISAAAAQGKGVFDTPKEITRSAIAQGQREAALAEGEKMTQESGSVQMNRLLAQLNEEGGFPISVLTDSQGLTIASAAKDGWDPERQSAVAAFMQKTILQVSKQLGMAGADEISFFDTNGQHLVCRLFTVNDHGLILAVMAPDRDHTYRRATNHAVIWIHKIWEQFWK